MEFTEAHMYELEHRYWMKNTPVHNLASLLKNGHINILFPPSCGYHVLQSFRISVFSRSIISPAFYSEESPGERNFHDSSVQ